MCFFLNQINILLCPNQWRLHNPITFERETTNLGFPRFFFSPFIFYILEEVTGTVMDRNVADPKNDTRVKYRSLKIVLKYCTQVNVLRYCPALKMLH